MRWYTSNDEKPIGQLFMNHQEKQPRYFGKTFVEPEKTYLLADPFAAVFVDGYLHRIKFKGKGNYTQNVYRNPESKLGYPAE